MNWHKVPFVRILIPFLLGILPAVLFPTSYFPQSFYFLCFLAPGLIFLHKAKIAFPYRRHFGILLYFFLFALGYQVAFFHLDYYQPKHFQNHLAKSNWVEGKILWCKTGQKNIQVAIDVSSFGLNASSVIPADGKLLVYIPKNKFNQEIPLFGDSLFAQVSIRKPTSSGNPKAFNFKNYLNRKNIFYQAYPPDKLKIKTPDYCRHPLRVAAQLQRYGLQLLQPYFPSDEEWSVAKALILGHRDETNGQIKKAYAASGAMHILAVSGLHVGIIVFFLNALLFFIPNYPYWKWFKTILLLLAIWSFALLTGASASVLRASTMFSFLIIGYTLNKATNIYNTLAASAFFLLLLNPLILFDIGFQLSYSAILGIIYFQPKLYGLIKPSSKLTDYAWKLLTVSIAAQISTAPIGLFYFHQFPTYFWLSGWFIIPAAAFILGTGFIVFLTSFTPAIQFYFGKLLYLSIKCSNQLIFLIEQLPGSLIENIWIKAFSVFVYYFIIMGIIYAVELKQFKGILFSLLCCCCLSFSYANKQWQLHQARDLYIYNIHQHSLIDIFTGDQLLTIQDDSLSEKKQFWAAHNNRSFYSNSQSVVNFDNQFSDSKYPIQYKDHILSFFGQSFLILDKRNSSLEGLSSEINYVLLRDNTSLPLNQIKEVAESACLIFDASNSVSQISTWEKQCQELQLKYINIRASGAFQLKL